MADQARGRYSPGTILTIVLLVAAGIVADSYRHMFDVAAWQLWGIIGAIVALALVSGRKPDVVEVPISLWHSKVEQAEYDTALKLLVDEIKENPEGKLPLFVEVANIYSHPDVGLPQDAVAWLDAVLEHIDDAPEVADILLQRANLYLYSLNKPRNAAIDLTRVVMQFPGTPAAERAKAIRSRLKVDFKKQRAIAAEANATETSA